MEPRIQYAKTSDGVSIAYTVDGEGPALMICPSLVESFALRHLTPSVDKWHDMLRERLTLVRYDMRGTGLSQREVTRFTADDVVADLEAVVDSTGLTRVGVCATALSGPRAITFAARHPDIVSHLILIDTLAAAEDAAINRASVEAIANLALTNWKLATQMLADMGSRALMTDDARRQEASETALQAAEVFERSSSGETIAAMIRGAFETWSAVEDLAQVAAPTLVIHHEDNFMFPIAAARRLTAGISDSSLMPLPGVVVGATSDPTQLRDIVNAIHEFLGAGSEARQPHRGASGTAIILFADIVDSTALTERLGDAGFRDKARDLDTTLRSIIRDARGTPVEGKLLGDGVLAVFSSARQAIEAALKCGVAGEDGGLPLHLGLHAGDVIEEDGNVFGGAVNIAARIAGESAAGEVLVSQTVRDLARTSAGVAFEDAGERTLKGVGEPVRVWRVTEQR